MKAWQQRAHALVDELVEVVRVGLVEEALAALGGDELPVAEPLPAPHPKARRRRKRRRPPPPPPRRPKRRRRAPPAETEPPEVDERAEFDPSATTLVGAPAKGAR